MLLRLRHGAGEKGCLPNPLPDGKIQVLLLLEEGCLLPEEGFLLLLCLLFLLKPCEHVRIGLLQDLEILGPLPEGLPLHLQGASCKLQSVDRV